MTNCHSPIGPPSFFPASSECGEPLAHDLRVEAGTLVSAQRQAISAILIQLHTDSRVDGEGGWWGDQFLPFPIGSRLWTLRKPGGASVTPLAKVDEMIREALAPLISRRVIDEVRVQTVRTLAGVDATVDAIKDGQSLFRTVFNG